MNTKFFEVDRVKYCSYCTREMTKNRGVIGGETAETFSCSCLPAIQETEMNAEIQQVRDDAERKIRSIERKYGLSVDQRAIDRKMYEIEADKLRKKYNIKFVGGTSEPILAGGKSITSLLVGSRL